MVQVYKTDLLEEALKELCSKLEGVQGAVIVSIEGFVVAAYTPHESEMDEEGPTSSPQVAAMAATLICRLACRAKLEPLSGFLRVIDFLIEKRCV